MPDRHRRALEHFIKLAAFDEFHAEIAGAIALVHLVDRDNARVIEACRSFCFQTKAPDVRFARPLAESNDFQRDCAVETFLPGAKYHTLTAATDFFQQLVVAQVSLEVPTARVGDPGHGVRQNPERCFERAGCAKASRRIRKDFRTAFSANSDYPDHCRSRFHSLLLYCVKFWQILRPEHRNEMA